ncbi:hypothetical protein ACFLVU_00320 [Chloroflexota bacterium]
MRLLRIAVKNKRWDLVAHTIVLATASALKNGDRPTGGRKAAGDTIKSDAIVKGRLKKGGGEIEKEEGRSEG